MKSESRTKTERILNLPPHWKKKPLGDVPVTFVPIHTIYIQSRNSIYIYIQAKFHTTSNILSIQCTLVYYMRWIYFGKIPKKLSGFLRPSVSDMEMYARSPSPWGVVRMGNPVTRIYLF